jgi:hypothetical protein
MARDLASVQQEIGQLKASQQELARENTGIVEQLKATQEQMVRAITSASGQNLRKTAAAAPANPPRPVAKPARKPVSTLPSTQARAQAGGQARAPVQLQSRQQ